MNIGIRIGGHWVSEIAPWSPPRWTTLADGGCGEASWRIQAPPTARHHLLRRGQLVEIRCGSANVWKGVLAEPFYGEDGWEMAASGLSSLSGDGQAGYLALTSLGDTTSTPDVAIDRAIADGLPWTRPSSLSALPFTDAGGDATETVFFLGDLLDRWADSASKRWGVDADGNVYAAADPTAPTWHLTPGSGTFGLADDNYASHVYLRYFDTSFTLATAVAGDAAAAAKYGRKEMLIDGRDYGAIDAAKAASLAQGFIDKGQARLGWTNTLEPSRWQLTTAGGTPAYLPMVKAQQMVRLHGVTDEQGQPVPYVDFVIGATDYDAAEDRLSIAPVGLVERNLVDLMTVSVE